MALVKAAKFQQASKGASWMYHYGVRRQSESGDGALASLCGRPIPDAVLPFGQETAFALAKMRACIIYRLLRYAHLPVSMALSGFSSL
jgi:hypothetical protein